MFGNGNYAILHFLKPLPLTKKHIFRRTRCKPQLRIFFCLYIYFLFFIFVLTLKIKGQFSYYGRDIINRIKFTLQWYTNAAQ